MAAPLGATMIAIVVAIVAVCIMLIVVAAVVCGCGNYSKPASDQDYGKNSGSSLLPDQSLQPPPEGIQAPPADLLVAPPVANAENFCSTRFHPHLGHSGGS